MTEIQDAPEIHPDQIPLPVAPADKYAVSTSWSSAKDYKEPFDYTLENGSQTCLIQRLDMADILRLGLAGNLDFMTKAIMSDSNKSESEAKESIVDVMSKGGDNFSKMEAMVNKVVLNGVLKPKIYAEPEHEAARQKGLLYIDVIPFNDRMELFGVIFDSDGLSTFRGEQSASVGDVPDVQDVQLPTDDNVELRPNDA